MILIWTTYASTFFKEVERLENKSKRKLFNLDPLTDTETIYNQTKINELVDTYKQE